MNVGLYNHSLFGLVKKYVHNNKYVLEVSYDSSSTDAWADKLSKLEQSYLKNKRMRFYLLPEEIFQAQEDQCSTRDSKLAKRTVIYGNYVITLAEELAYRHRRLQYFETNQLWYFLYALVKGALEFIEIQELLHHDLLKEINPDTILLSDHGYLKIIGLASTPSSITPKPAYRAPEFNTPIETMANKWETCLSFSIGRIMASLITLKDMSEYTNPINKIFNNEQFQKDFNRDKQRYPLLPKFVQGLFIQQTQKRILLSEVKAMLVFNQDKILSLENFGVDKTLAKLGLMKTFVDTS